jgi:hypothetical protein
MSWDSLSLPSRASELQQQQKKKTKLGKTLLALLVCSVHRNVDGTQMWQQQQLQLHCCCCSAAAVLPTNMQLVMSWLSLSMPSRTSELAAAAARTE